MSQVQTVIRWIQQRLRTIRAGVPAAAALAVLLLVGAVVALAAPGSSVQRVTGQTAQATATQGLAQKSGASATGAAGSPSPTVSATATSAPRTHQNVVDPTPTDTPTTPPPPDPTATATATATPVPPSWHTVGTYSGNGPGRVVTLTNVTASKVRLSYTCDASGGSWQIGFSFTVVGGLDGGSGLGVCSPGNTTGGDDFSVYAPGHDWNIDMVDTADAGGPWVATVYEWY